MKYQKNMKKPAKKTPAKTNGNGNKKGLTAKQKKLPKKLQEAILKKQNKK
jgi:hypothetical protein